MNKLFKSITSHPSWYGIFLGSALILIYSSKDFVSFFPLRMMISIAFFLIGFLFGFLFGIPKIIANDSSNQKIEVNTNLEQISDWLTKIFVGIGLTQLQKIKDSFIYIINELYFGFNVSKNEDIAKVMTTGVLIYFGLLGCMVGYNWTVFTFSQKVKNNLDSLEEVKQEVKILQKIQIIRQIIDIIPYESVFSFLNITYEKTEKEKKEYIETIDNIVGTTINNLRQDMKNNKEKIPKDLEELIKDIDKDKESYIFLRSTDYTNLGSLCFLQKNYEKVIEFCNRATNINELSYNGYNLLGLTYFQQAVTESQSQDREKDKYKKAINNFGKAIKNNTMNYSGWLNRGYAKIKLIQLRREKSEEEINIGLVKDAIDAFTDTKKALELNSNLASAHTNLGFIILFFIRYRANPPQNLESGDISKINDEIGKIEKEFQIEFGESYLLESYKEAIRIDPNYARAYYNRACYYSLNSEHNKDNITDGLEDLIKAFERNEDIKKYAKQDPELENIKKYAKEHPEDSKITEEIRETLELN